MPAHDNHESQTMDYDDHLRAAINDLREAHDYNDVGYIHDLLHGALDHITAALDLRDASR